MPGPRRLPPVVAARPVGTENGPFGPFSRYLGLFFYSKAISPSSSDQYPPVTWSLRPFALAGTSKTNGQSTGRFGCISFMKKCHSPHLTTIIAMFHSTLYV